MSLLIIGCGNMGGAMLAGWLAAGHDPMSFSILDPGLNGAPDGVALYRSSDEVPGEHNAVLLGFKPHQLGDLAPRLQSLVAQGVAVHYLLAGLTLSQLKAAFPGVSEFVRVMPNLAARVNKSPVLLTQSGLDEAKRREVHAFYNALGTAVWLEDEGEFDLLTALTGSGPGFVYRFIDALAKAATRLGVDEAVAIRLSTAMVDGASTLAASADISPGDLADRVASPGGMTREGLNVLDEGEVLVELLTETLDQTAKRGAALSAQNG
mgnify:CR=1 FL=1